MNVIDQLKEKHARELAELETHEAIAAALPSPPTRIYVSSLYGREASATYGDSYKAQYVTPAELAELVAQMPPLPILRKKDGCTSFPLESWFDSLPDDHRDKRGELQSIAPFLIRVDLACVPQHHHAPKVEITWTTRLAGRNVQIAAIMNPHKLITYSFDRENQTNRNARVVNTHCALLPPWDAVHHQDHGDNIEKMDVIKWGRGSDDSGHAFTFFTGLYDLDTAHHFQRTATL